VEVLRNNYRILNYSLSRQPDFVSTP